ncbi:MAG: NucA/NucB deoxyribonuclease domain-containing protein [Dehalococcoidia bacterium]
MIECALDTEVWFEGGTMKFGGCGGLAHNLQHDFINTLGSSGIFSPPPQAPALPDPYPGVPRVKISKSRYPESAQHILDAQDGVDVHIPGQRPALVTIDRPGADRRGRQAMAQDYVPERCDPGPQGNAQERDEYPPKVFAEGGTEGKVPADVRCIDARDNAGSGGQIGRQINNPKLPDETKVLIVVVP